MAEEPRPLCLVTGATGFPGAAVVEGVNGVIHAAGLTILRMAREVILAKGLAREVEWHRARR